jgi:type II secretory pathway component PulF
MYRKIALTSVTLNVAFVFGTLFFFVPRFSDLFKHLQVEMPRWMMLLINASHFVTSPQTIVPTLAILLIGFFGVKAFRKRV